MAPSWWYNNHLWSACNGKVGFQDHAKTKPIQLPTKMSLANLLIVDVINEQDREYGKYFQHYSVWVWLYFHVTCQGKTERFVLFSKTKYKLTLPKWSAIKITVRNCDIDSLIV